MVRLQAIERTIIIGVLLLLVSFCLIPLVARGQRLDLSIASVRTTFVNALASEKRAAREYAEIWAQINGVPTHFERGDVHYELIAIENGRPLYYRTFNLNAAISTTADLVRVSTDPQGWFDPKRVDGDGLTIGLWDHGLPLTIHGQFSDDFGASSRVSHRDVANVLSHATHVACTIGGSGSGDLAAQGMAPRVGIDAYDWEYDSVEMAQRGAARPGEMDKIYISNHSYGPPCGWEWDPQKGGYEWHGEWLGSVVDADSVEDRFGRYINRARDFDDIAYNAPYYLIFSAAGNDRNDNPADGTRSILQRFGANDSSGSGGPTTQAPFQPGMVR